MNVPRVAVLGSGSWGTALAIQLARRQPVTLWGRDREAIERMVDARENAAYLPGARFPDALTVTSNLAGALDGAPVILVAVPSHALHETLVAAAPGISDDARVAFATKGFEPDSGRMIHEVAATVLGAGIPLAVVSGPSFAREVAAGQPTAITVATADGEFATVLAEALHGPRFRVYTTDDVIGVEIGGAVKNVIAIATGLADGLGFGANARAALITRGLAEMVRLGEALGGRAETFLGLTGIGDLVLTCTDDQSRNRRYGLALGRGTAHADATRDIGQVVEGVSAALEVMRLAQRQGIDMPICEQVHRILHEGVAPLDAFETLMSRDPKPE